MNTTIKRILLVLLVIALAFTLIACNTDETSDPQTPSGDGGGSSGAVPNTPNVNQAVVFDDIRNALVNTGADIGAQQTGVRNVTSDYTLIVNGINVGVTYKANYNYNRKQDSEIYLEIYDYLTPRPAVFIYYANNDLYYRFDDKLTVREDFGGSSAFELFYDTITVFDLEYIFFDESFAQKVDTMKLVDNAGISRIKLDEDTDIVNIRKIELNIIAESVRDFIANNFRVLGDRFDAITNTYLGFNFSALGMISPLGLNAETLEVTYTTGENNRKTMDKFSVVFSGTQTDYVSKYYLEANYETSATNKEITLSNTHSPDTNVYEESKVGQSYLTGSLVIPAIDADFKVDIKTKLNVEDNSENQFIIDIRNRSEILDSANAINEEILMTYYRDGKLYVDATGLLKNYVGGIVDTSALNLPKVKFEKLNVAEELINLIDTAKSVTGKGLSFTQILDDFKNKEGGIGILLSKVRSEGSVVYLTIDEELVSVLAGEKIESLFDLFGEKLGIESTELEQFKELDIFKDLYLELAYDTVSDLIVIKGYNASGSVFTLTLTIQETDDNFTITYPEDAYFATFNDFAVPECMNVHINADIRMQGQEYVDFSKFMGVFIGDVTGANTPFNLAIQDRINMVADIWNKGDDIGLSLILKYNNDILVIARTSPTDPSTVLVDNRMDGYNVKYSLPVEEMLALFDELVDGKSILKYDTIAEMYMAIVKDARVRMGDDAIAFTLAQSVMKEIIGVDALIADVRVSFTFDEPTTDLVPSEYVAPVINIENEVIYESMYEAQWIDSAEVIFGSGFKKTFSLTFIGDSATLVTGKNAYHPEAKLLGKTVTYGLYFSDEVNGTKVARELLKGTMNIDPTELAPFPEKIDVIYDDNTRGKLDYVIENFPYNNNNIAQAIGGVDAQEYELVVGKGSIAETRFKVNIKILGRILLNNAGKYNDITIVDTVEIDPYEYAINRAKDASYNPIRYKGSLNDKEIAPTTLKLEFTDYKNTAKDIVYLDEVEWDFDLSSINYGGNVDYIATGKYNTMDIAIKILVLAKHVAYVQINTENSGYYTVDALKKDTYTIPTITNANNEVRIYFESGTYRIIGEEPAGYVKTDDKCDGYYPEALNWEFKVADSVASTGVVWCLNNGTTDRTTSVFGSGAIGDLVGKQNVTVTVVCPERIIPVSNETTMAITSVQYASDGKVSITEKNAVNVSAISFTKDGALYSAFDFDPYSGAEDNVNLPKVIYTDVVYQGRTQRIAYPVTWVAGLEGQDNIIDNNGKILNALVQEEYLRVTGYIGDGDVKVSVTALIHNLSGEYESVIMYDASGNVMTNVIETIKDGKAVYSIEGLNPYDKLVLPTSFKLHFPIASGIEDREYQAHWLTQEGTLASEKIYPYGGGEFIITTELVGSESTGMLDQVIELKLVFKQMTIINDLLYGISSDLDKGTVVTHPNATYPHAEGESAISVKYVVVDGYSQESRELINVLENRPAFVGITFAGETTKSENIPIVWNEFYDAENDVYVNELDNLIACLKDPCGSNTSLTGGKYDLYDIGYDLVTMTGVIYEGTPLEQNVSISFMVNAKVLTAMTFTNYTSEFKNADNNGVVPIDIDVNMKKVETSTNDETGEETKYMTGSNTISMVINKPFTLKGMHNDTYTSLTPSEYIDYLFSNVKLAFMDSHIGEYSFVYDLDELLRDAEGYYEGKQGGKDNLEEGEFNGLRYFDKVAYGQIKVTNSEYVTYTTDTVAGRNTVTIKFKVHRLSSGSTEQSFDCELTVVLDEQLDVYFYEYVETFDENGLPKYNTLLPYEIDDVFNKVEYEKSGVVAYNGLVWRASYSYSTNGVSIAENDVVKSIPVQFFRFTEGISITLHTTLVDGTEIHRNFVFLKKNVNKTEYNAKGEEDVYDIVDGTLTVYNVYKIYPLMEMINKLPQTITPKITSEFLSDGTGTTINFTLDTAWKPSADFDDGNGNFSKEKLESIISSYGVGKMLFATSTISGYNGAKQTIELYIEVFQLIEGDIYSDKLNLAGKSSEFDPYSSADNDGTLELPQDLLLKFGDESHKFASDSGIKYMLRDTTGEFTEVEVISYNKSGHTMGASFGGKNDALYVKLILPDGNETCYFTIKFLDRTLTSVYYENNANKQGVDNLIEGVYYVDPYDPTTWTLPSKGTFIYGGSERSELNITWENKSSNATAFESKNGVYSYSPEQTTNYMGGVYLFSSHLRGFGDNDPSQYFIMTVVVLNRNMTDKISNGSYKFDEISPFAGRVEDIPSDLSNETFTDLSAKATYDSYKADTEKEIEKLQKAVKEANVTWYTRSFVVGDNIYSDYNAIATPVTPRIFWGTESNGEFTLLVDDDIDILGGFSKTLVGYVGTKNGEEYSYGQKITSYTISADKWEFLRIDGIDSIVEFNRFTMSSLADSFKVVFRVNSKEVTVTFYPEDRADDDDKRRVVIKWGDDLQEGDNSTRSITFANLFKSDSIETEKIYKLVFQQLYVDEISFGYGDNDGYGKSGQVNLVIDPLNPVIPTSAYAKGRTSNGSNPVESDLGVVTIDWEDTSTTSDTSIYNLMFGGGERTVVARVYDKLNNVYYFNVRVSYLNRTPSGIYTTGNQYSTAVGTNIGGKQHYAVMIANEGKKNSYFNVDPIGDLVYNRKNADGSYLYKPNTKYVSTNNELIDSTYVLPSELRVLFDNNYTAGSLLSSSLDNLGSDVLLTNVKWIISRDITLTGTAKEGVILARVAGFNVQYETKNGTVVSEYYDFTEPSSSIGTNLTLQLTVADRTVEYTSISSQEGPANNRYQQANVEYFVDPYNVSFPDSILVKFTGIAKEREFTNIVWEYNESILKETDIVSGKAGEDRMYLMAGFAMFGTKLEINFSIKARYIDANIDTGSSTTGMKALKGGTLYVLKGIPVEEQLPTRLYYAFEDDVASVPLTFSDEQMSIVNVNYVGAEVVIKGTLGVDSGNIEFTVKVIDPEVYALRAQVKTETIGGHTSEIVTYYKSGFRYDEISVGVNRNGIYAVGPEVGLLPERIIVTDAGDYLEVDNVVYDTTNMLATFYCKYTFLSAQDNPKLSGSKDGEDKDKLAISFTVPITTYDYSAIEATFAELSATTVDVELGAILDASTMPTVGGIKPFWYLSDVNTNKAGTYKAICYFKNAYGDTISGEVLVNVKRRQLLAENAEGKPDVEFAKEFTNKNYTGEQQNVEEYLTFATFLREDGTMGKLQGYTVEYSLDGGATWQLEQPVNVPTGAYGYYLVRVKVYDEDDYNYTGSVGVRMIINKTEISQESITFHKTESDNVAVTSVSYVYNGREQIPHIKGIPLGATYDLQFAKYEENLTNDAFSTALRPTNVGKYVMKVVFTADQRNYLFQGTDDITVVIEITKKTVDFKIERNMVYSGQFMDAKIIGLPDNLGDMKVSYKYYLGETPLADGSRIRNVGTYNVIVTINGGTNYNSAELRSEIYVTPKDVILNVNEVSSEYLDALKPFNSSITIVDANDPTLSGLQGTDTLSLFGNIKVKWEGGTLTNKHMVGDYTLVLEDEAGVGHANYNIIAINNGVYRITALQEGARVIDNKDELDDAIALLEDEERKGNTGMTVKWYLRAGDYGDITINVNASITIIGSYDLSDEKEEIAVKFNTITINKGAVLLDIVKFNALGDKANVYIARNATSATIKRAEFVRQGVSTIINSIAIRSEDGFKGSVYVYNSYIYGYAQAMYLYGGKLEMENTTLEQNVNGIYVRGDVLIKANTFKETRGPAINIATQNATVAISGNTFQSNVTAIESASQMRNDIEVQNTFIQNATDIKKNY